MFVCLILCRGKQPAPRQKIIELIFLPVKITFLNVLKSFMFLILLLLWYCFQNSGRQELHFGDFLSQSFVKTKQRNKLTTLWNRGAVCLGGENK